MCKNSRALCNARIDIIEDGSTWTGSEEWLAREVERANISDARHVRYRRCIICRHRDRWRQEHEGSKYDRRAAKLCAIFLMNHRIFASK